MYAIRKSSQGDSTKRERHWTALDRRMIRNWNSCRPANTNSIQSNPLNQPPMGPAKNGRLSGLADQTGFTVFLSKIDPKRGHSFCHKDRVIIHFLCIMYESEAHNSLSIESIQCYLSLSLDSRPTARTGGEGFLRSLAPGDFREISKGICLNLIEQFDLRLQGKVLLRHC